VRTKTTTARTNGLLNNLWWAYSSSLFKSTLIIYAIFIQGSHSQTEHENKFVNVRKIDPQFKGPYPIFTGDFNNLVDKHYPKANYVTRQLPVKIG
jgi:hypothetical protein